MSKGLSYFLGILTGILLTVGFLVIVYHSSNNDETTTETTERQAKLPEGVSLLDEPVPFTEAKNFQVLQVVFSDGALAQSKKKMQYTGTVYYTDPVVLIIADKENAFYDNQIIKAPNGSKVMQVGTYNYSTQMGRKTVPIIRFINE